MMKICDTEAMKRLLMAAMLLPAWAMAQDSAKPVPKTMAELYPPLPGVEYYCTNAQGTRIDLGGVICITASCTTWMARCEMSANNNLAMWRKVQDGCPAASLLERFQRLEPAGQARLVHSEI